MSSLLKEIAKGAVRRAVGFLPRPSSRLTGRLAREGGSPVRDLRFRPWPKYHSGNRYSWMVEVGPALRRIFLSGVEGLPQERQKAFAREWANYCGCRHGLLLAHGTDALRIGLASLLDHDGLEYGGEVIVPNLSFIASATAALDRRFGVALVDVDPATLLLDPKCVEDAIVPGKTRAVMPVHQFGQPADMTAISAIAKKHGLKVLEDAAQAHGASWETGPVGSLGDAAAFSFQSAKNLTCGEGGMLTTNSDEVFARADSMHNVGRAPGGGDRWDHLSLGWNVRPTEYQAAILHHRFARFPAQQETRASNFRFLRAALGEVTSLVPLAVHPGVRRHGMYMFVMRYRPDSCNGLGLDQFLEAVRSEGAPIHRAYATTMADQPVLRNLAARRPEYLRVLPTPVADSAANEIVYIPQNVFLGDANDMSDIVAAVWKVERHFRAKGGARGE